MNIKLIYLNEIKILTFLLKEPFYNEKLKKSILNNGFIYPIRVVCKNKNFYIIDGIKRYFIAEELEIKNVPVIIENYKSEKFILVSHIKYNNFRDFNDVEIAKFINSAIDYFKDEYLAKYILKKTEKKISEKLIYNYKRLNNLSIEAKRLLIDNKLNFNVAISISKYDKDVQSNFIRLIKNLKLNSNKQKKAFEYIYNLSKRQGKKLMEILKLFEEFIDNEYSKHLEDKFFEKLTEIHSPDYYKFHKNFLEVKGKITDKIKGVNIISPSNYEDDIFKTEIFFKDFNELSEKLNTLEKNIKKFNVQ